MIIQIKRETLKKRDIKFVIFNNFFLILQSNMFFKKIIANISLILIRGMYGKTKI